MRQNVASDIIPGKVLSSKSGTLAYLAPEVYAGKGYDRRADWWSLGVLFYECIYNKVGLFYDPILALVCDGASSYETGARAIQRKLYELYSEAGQRLIASAETV